MSLTAYYSALKPERTYANVLTTGAGFLFASHWQVNWSLLGATIFGTTFVVMSACAANNYTDRDLDARMPRTKHRGLVTGEINRLRVLALAIVLGLGGFALLAVYVNWLTVLVGVVAYIDYVILYAWSKRHTVHSTLIGTVSGAAPIVAGYTAVLNRFGLTALLLALVMVFWQMVHFYAIAIFRRNDYAAGGLPVWAVVKGVHNTQLWIIFYALLFLISVAGLATVGKAGLVVGLAGGLLAIYWLWLGLRGFGHLHPEKWARGMFGFSLVVLLAFSAILALSPLLKYR